MDNQQGEEKTLNSPEDSKLSVSPEQLQQMFNDHTLPKFYANAFVIGNSATDVFLVSYKNGIPQFLTNLSFSAAKELLRILTKRVGDIEVNMGNELKTFQATK